MPVILKVENTSEEVQKDIELLDCLNKLKQSVYSPYPGLPKREGIDISSGHPRIDYEDVLLQIATGGEINMNSVSMKFSHDIFQASLTFRSSDVFGNAVTEVIYFEYEPEADLRLIKSAFATTRSLVIDKTTSLILDKLDPGSSVRIQIYDESERAATIRWHDPSEKPEPGRDILIDNGEVIRIGKINGNATLVIVNQDEDELPTSIGWDSVLRWSYVQVTENDFTQLP